MISSTVPVAVIADRADARELAGVAADLVRRVAVHANQFEVGARADSA